MNLKLLFLLLSIIFYSFLISGCGYKPTSYYAKSAIGSKVFVNTKIDIDNSDSSIFLKDKINEMVLTRFKAILVNKEELADTVMNIKLLKVFNKAIFSDNKGYAKTYRVFVRVVLEYKKEDSEKRVLKSSNYYDYTLNDDSSLDERKKNEAVKKAVEKAISDIFSKIAVENY